MLTAVALGALFLAGAGWVWKQLAAVAIPTPTWRLQAADVSGASTAGTTLQLQRFSGGQTVELGTAQVLSYSGQGESNGELLVGSLKMGTNQSPLDTNRVRIAGINASAAPTFLATITRAEGIPAFQRVYLQAGAAGVLLLIGGVLIYWYVGLNRKSVDFLIATDGEMKKVNWSTKKHIQHSTSVVIAVTFLLAGVIFLFDVILQAISKAAGLLGVS